MSDTDSAGLDIASESPKAAASDRVFLVLVDNSEEMAVALKFACNRAKNTDGRIALLHVSEPLEFMHWLGVENLMREENREQGEELLQKNASIVLRNTGKAPILIVREGDRAQAVSDVLQEEKEISILVLAASTSAEGPGPVVTYLTGKGLSELNIPITIVPGGLTDEQIEAIT